MADYELEWLKFLFGWLALACEITAMITREYLWPSEEK